MNKIIHKGILIVLLYSIPFISYSQIISTIAGNGEGGSACGGTYSGDNGPATAAGFRGSYGVAIDALGNIYVADNGDCRIRKVNTLGIISTIAVELLMASPATEALLQMQNSGALLA